MFNPKLDMKDSEEKAKPLPEWAFKKRQDPNWVVAKILGALGFIGLAVLFATGFFNP